MRIYKYIVHSHPDNISEGWPYNSIDEAKAAVAGYGELGACISEVSYVARGHELVYDSRPGSELNLSVFGIIL